MEGNLQNIFMEHDLYLIMIFGIKEKWIILTHTMYNIPVRIKTSFVFQSHNHTVACMNILDV